MDFLFFPRPQKVLRTLLEQGIGKGGVKVTFHDGTTEVYGLERPTAHVSFKSEEAYGQILSTGDIGFGEAWMSGEWTVDDLSAMFYILAANRDTITKGLYSHSLYLLVHKLWSWLRANTKAMARKNIEAHYDLGNSFYSLWLDRTMTYSSALFLTPEMSLEDAQKAKVRRILQRLNPAPGSRILEIGCGWGGFAEIAALEFGCHVHGITLSPAQLEWCKRRAAENGFADRATFEIRDYRDVKETFDYIASVEMFEAVGESYWPSYFCQVAACLRPNGKAVIQTITIGDEHFASYRWGVDFIQRYIFPGGKMASPSLFVKLAAQAGLQLTDDLAFGKDYARTLKIWHESFLKVLPEVKAQGFDDRFIRMWRFYLSYCEAGFGVGRIDVHQYEFTKEA